MDRKPKILLVEDDPDFQKITNRVLQSKSFQVVIADNGAEGLRKMRSEKPDLILLDIMIPEKDGFVVADEMSKDPTIASIPVLALTSFSESIGQPFPFKVSEYLPKSTKPADLLAKIEKHLKNLGFFADQPKPPDYFPQSP